MPHCKIEVTQNLIGGVDIKSLMKEISNGLNKSDLFNSDDIKVRVYPIEHSFLGIEEQDHSYVTAELMILDRRSEKTNITLLDSVQEVLLKYFYNPKYKTSITSRLTLLDTNYYKRAMLY